MRVAFAKVRKLNEGCYEEYQYAARDVNSIAAAGPVRVALQLMWTRWARAGIEIHVDHLAKQSTRESMWRRGLSLALSPASRVPARSNRNTLDETTSISRR